MLISVLLREFLLNLAEENKDLQDEEEEEIRKELEMICMCQNNDTAEVPGENTGHNEEEGNDLDPFGVDSEESEVSDISILQQTEV